LQDRGTIEVTFPAGEVSQREKYRILLIYLSEGGRNWFEMKGAKELLVMDFDKLGRLRSSS
jgi:hypothetical protein